MTAVYVFCTVEVSLPDLIQIIGLADPLLYNLGFNFCAQAGLFSYKPRSSKNAKTVHFLFSDGFEFSRKGSEYGSAMLKQFAGFFMSDKCEPANRKKGFHTSRFLTPFQVQPAPADDLCKEKICNF
jgi:hypothetical protein